MVGKGSVNHNSRKFIAENVDPERTRFNIEYCNEPIRDVYHRLFDEALEEYNAKQTRADRRIDNYYEKIRTGKQEKLFHELIIQIGNRDDITEAANYERVKSALDEYFKEFQSRNPNLYVFSAHLHCDEATPHLHIDFVPYVTGSKRGLSTRVSLKSALATEGFHGGTRKMTEWNQWVRSEKEYLAVTMERYGFEWEQKGTHDEHLSVIEYKKQERMKELEAVNDAIADKTEEYNGQLEEMSVLAERFNNLKEGKMDLKGLDIDLSRYRLDDPPALMSARAYREKVALPVVNALKKIAKGLMVKFIGARDNFLRLSREHEELKKERNRDSDRVKFLEEKNKELERANRDYLLLRKVFGNERVDEWIERARDVDRQKKHMRREHELER